MTQTFRRLDHDEQKPEVQDHCSLVPSTLSVREAHSVTIGLYTTGKACVYWSSPQCTTSLQRVYFVILASYEILANMAPTSHQCSWKPPMGSSLATSSLWYNLILSLGAGIAQTDYRAWRPGFDPQAVKDLYHPYSVQTSSWAHAASYPMRTGGSFPRAWSWPLTSI
jgi:hypothetical protein